MQEEVGMRRLLWVFVSALLLVSSMTAQDLSSAADRILENERALGVAMIHRDVATLARLVADDWTIQSEGGSTGTKSGFIDDVRTGRLVVSSFKLHDMHVRVFGDVAVLQGADDEVSLYDGKTSNGTYNWLDVWVKRDGRWVSVATQLTRVKAEKK
jgi:ketosteroid isomerase-like protein